MNKKERDDLKKEVYALWYREKNDKNKATFQKMLDLLDFTDDNRRKLKSIRKLFSDMLGIIKFYLSVLKS